MSPKVRRLVKLLSRLPGVGEKTAQRYVLWLLTADEALSRDLGRGARALRDELGPCERCGNIAEIRDGRARLRRLQRRQARREAALRRRARARPHGDRARRVDARAVLRARAAPLAARGHRPRRPAARARSSSASASDGVDRGHRRDAAERRRRGHRAAAEARARAARRRRDAHRERRARTAATSSSPTRSRWVARSPGAARCRLRPMKTSHRDPRRTRRHRPVLAGRPRREPCSSSAGRSRSTRPRADRRRRHRARRPSA